MRFPSRAVRDCVTAMELGRVSERHVRNVLRFDDVDVSKIERFLKSDDSMIRRMASRIIGERGRVDLVVEAALAEVDRSVLISMLKSLRKRDGLDRLAVFLNDSSTIVKEEAISMFRESDNVDCLLLLMFDEDTTLVERAKRYIDEQRSK